MAQLQEFEGNPAHFQPNRPFQGDDRLPVRFYMWADKDEEASLTEGRPIYRDVEYIQIINSKDNILERPVRDTDKARWPQQYNAWKLSGKSEPGAVGTPLEHWPQLTRAQVEEYRYFKIFTVEQLADMPDSTGGPIRNFQKNKVAARAYVEAARGEAPLLRMQAQIDERDSALAALRSQMEQMQKQMAEMQKNQ
jgi:hypothetical protein